MVYTRRQMYIKYPAEIDVESHKKIENEEEPYMGRGSIANMVSHQIYFK